MCLAASPMISKLRMTASNFSSLARSCSRDSPLVKRTTFSQAWRMSLRNSPYSRDTEQLLFDVRHEFLTQSLPRQQIHAGAQRLFEELFEIHVSIKRGWSIKLDQHIHIAV